MSKKVFEQIWSQLRGKKAQYQEFLEKISIQELRGISDLTVRFDFPLAVIAGPNGSGKSTVLFSCACAYQKPPEGRSGLWPGNMFPNLKVKTDNTLNDNDLHTSFTYTYTHLGKSSGMVWRKGKNWNKSFLGQKGGEQPERYVYLRTLANLTSPSEVRGYLQIAYTTETATEITSDLIAFAQRIISYKYKKVRIIRRNEKELLAIEREDTPAKYSEFHMSAGERAILRISKDISNLKNALILIDEIEAGLHPMTQQQLMLELMRLALRNNLQIIVTTHSPVILECVPIEARIFLERSNDNVIVKPAYRDVIEKALYGQSLEKLSVLCEDEIAENFLFGVMDILNPKLNLMPDDIKIGRDTGKEMFKQHIEVMSKFKLLDDFLFILDGDALNMENELKLRANELGYSIQPLFLPGDVPERWAWGILNQTPAEYAGVIGITESDLRIRMKDLDRLYDNATDKPANIMKNKFHSFCEMIRRSETELMRRIASKEAEKQSPEIKIFMDAFELQLRNWQSRNK